MTRLEPSRGAGVDISPMAVEIARSKHPGLTFMAGDAEEFDPGEKFDYVIVPDVVEHLSDAGAMFRSARKSCHARTRVIVTGVNPLWAPVLHFAERLGLKMPEGEHRWLPAAEPRRLAGEARFDTAEFSGGILCPKEVPLLADALKREAKRFAFLRPVCLTQILVFTPR